MFHLVSKRAIFYDLLILNVDRDLNGMRKCKINEASERTFSAIPQDRETNFVVLQSQFGFRVQESLLIRHGCLHQYTDPAVLVIQSELKQIIENGPSSDASFDQICGVHHLKTITSILFSIEKRGGVDNEDNE